MIPQGDLLLDIITVLQPGDTVNDVAALIDHTQQWAGKKLNTVCVYDASGNWDNITAHSWGEQVQLVRGFWDNDLGRARLDALNTATAEWAIILTVYDRLSGDAKKLATLLNDPHHHNDDYGIVEVTTPAQTFHYGRVVRPRKAATDTTVWETLDTAFLPEQYATHIPADTLRITQHPEHSRISSQQHPRRLTRLLREAEKEKTADNRQCDYEIATEYQHLGEIDTACQAYAKLSAGEDDWAWAAREAWADLLTSQQNLQAAAPLLEQLEAGPNPDFAAWLRAKWCAAAGKTAQALELMQNLEPPTPTLGTSFPEDAVLRARLRLASRAGRQHDELTSRLTLLVAGMEIQGAGKKLLNLWGKRRPEDLAEVILSTRTNHLEDIAEEFDHSPYPGNLVARVIRQHRQRYSVAAVIIARDEARCIQRCINSIKPFVDEVLVADTGSEDNTAELAQAAGARVIHVPWTNNFAAARNTALDAAAADWHVIIDADETIAAGGRELRDLHDLSPEFVLTVNVISSFRLGEATTTESEPQSRILPGSVRYCGLVHATPEHDFPLRQVQITIEHDGYEPEQLAEKLPRRERLLHAAVNAEPNNAYLRYQLGRNLETQGRLAEAATQYDTIDFATLEPEPWQHILIVQYAHTLTSIGRSVDALTLLAAHTDRFDHSPDCHFVAGNVLLDLATQQPDLAAELLPQSVAEFRRALELGEPDDLPGHVTGRGSHLAARNLAVVEQGCRDLGIQLPQQTTSSSVGDDSPSSIHESRGDSEEWADLTPLPAGSLDVVMIVKNEEAHLAQTLESCESLRPLLGEICVYDTGSTDNTQQIARDHGARLEQGFWDDNYSRARNAAAAMSNSPWLLVVDADERVFANPTELALELAKGEQRNDETLYIEAAPTDTDGKVRASGEYWMSPRLYRPDLASYARPVHAELRSKKGKRYSRETHVPRTAIRLENDGFGQDRIKASIARALHLTDVAATSRADASDSLAVLVDKARALWSHGDVEHAREALQQATAMSSSTTYYRWAYQWLARLELTEGTPEAAAEAIDALKGMAPTDSYTRWLEAHLLLANKHASQASKILQRLDEVVDAVGLLLPPEDLAEAQLVAARQADDARAVAQALVRLGQVRGDDELVHKARAALQLP
ncbi:SPBc2 prophage-derived glycosyltransferase SunS [Dermatophilus congolensis]|uniref:SPBc2 prophage-derived glycosyltransferase SunS n=1 Tax=Dermatophilus congolensis TaxID=1863 RepID=A0AA46H0Y8_9MICO|nr:glycosyltransferase [Dermatophilus congolensis]STD11906.1 SPBc2 prophage-derived glycosyltransferase SunS [Dermatophilus congolensis]